MKKLGIIGGMGPMATIYFMRKIIDMTDAATDQEHIEIAVEHCPGIPDRTAYILDHTKENPLPSIIRAGNVLADAGAEKIAIPCVTAHFFHDECCRQIRIPVYNGVEETAGYLHRRGLDRVGVMATTGTVRTGLFKKALKEKGMEAVYPDEKMQGYVMDIIYDDIKAGRKVDEGKFEAVAAALKKEGAQVIVLGCTELSVAVDQYHPNAPCIDVLDVLSRCCVRDFARLKEEYEELIR